MLFSQRRRVVALIRTFWMIYARCCCHQHYRRELPTTIFTGVFALIRAFIQLVATFVRAVGMTDTRG